MNSLLANYENNNNFWKLYPSYKTPKLYKELYDNDKSKNKIESSNIMWALIFWFDKTEYNPYKTLQSTDKAEVINEDVLNNSKFDWTEYKELKDFTHKLLMTEIERTYYAYLEKMEERRILIETSKYTIDNAEDIDKIIKNTDFVRKELDNLKRLVDLQETEGRTKGDMIESATEKGLI